MEHNGCRQKMSRIWESSFHKHDINFLGHVLNIFYKIPKYIMFYVSHHYGRHVTAL